MSWDNAMFIANVVPAILFIAILTTVAVLIIRGIKRISQRNYELAKYRAETERIKAEAMRGQAKQGNEE